GVGGEGGGWARGGRGGQEDQDPGREPVTAEEILGQCLARDGRQKSATDTREAEWSDADRLDVLGVQWEHVARQAQQRGYEAAVRDALPEQQAQEVMDDPAATWLVRGRAPGAGPAA